MTSTQDFVAGLTFVEGRGDASIDAEARTVGVIAPARSDLIADPVSGALTRGAPVLASPAPAGDFVFSAQVTVPGERSTYDAGVLALYVNERLWAKLCFEYSPDAEAMVVGVVTDGFSDDSNGDVIAGDRVFLRIARLGEAFAFHHSPDGVRWRFLRVFRLGTAQELEELRIGFAAQSPLGEGRVAEFAAISLEERRLADLRDGS